MADWSNLEQELLYEIISHLYSTPIDLLRLRLVCSSWRTFLPIPLFLPPPDHSLMFLNLSNYTFYRLCLPNEEQGWLVRLQQDSQSHKFHFINPLFKKLIKPLPHSFPNFLDPTTLQISQFGQEYISSVYHKLVLSPFLDLVMTVKSGELGLFFPVEGKKWGFQEFKPDFYCNDVIYYKENFYAVDLHGVLIALCPNLKFEVIAYSSLYGEGQKKWLVESDGELLLVDMYNYLSNVFDDVEDFIERRVVSFQVLKLDWEAGEWIEVISLGGRMLILGENSSFSALASEFYLGRANCIYFSCENSSYKVGRGPFRGDLMGVYDIKDGCCRRLEYPNVFWPPPPWVTSQIS